MKLFIPGGVTLWKHFVLPTAVTVHWRVSNPCKVGRHLDLAFHKRTHSFSAKATCEPKHLANNILSRTRFQICGVDSADIIWCHDDHGKACGTPMFFKFLYDGLTGIRLLVKNDG